MPKPLAAFDVDGSLFKSSLAEKLVTAGIEAGMFAAEPFNAVFVARRRWQRDNNEGVYQSYLHHLVSALVQQMAGVDVEQFNRVADGMLAEHQIRQFAFPRRLMRALADSHYIVAVSGSPELLVRSFLGKLPVQAVYGSTFEVVDGKFTGNAQSVGNKADVLNQLDSTGVATWDSSVAVGDTISDLPMLARASAGIMFNASRTLTSRGRLLRLPRVQEVKDQVTLLLHDETTGGYVEADVKEFMASLAQPA